MHMVLICYYLNGYNLSSNEKDVHNFYVHVRVNFCFIKNDGDSKIP